MVFCLYSCDMSSSSSDNMTTLVPRSPCSKDELNILYPKLLKLQLVQVVRGPTHGEVVVLQMKIWITREGLFLFPKLDVGRKVLASMDQNLHAVSFVA